MKKKTGRVLLLLFTLVFMVSTFGLTAFATADSSDGGGSSVSENTQSTIASSSQPPAPTGGTGGTDGTGGGTDTDGTGGGTGTDGTGAGTGTHNTGDGTGTHGTGDSSNNNTNQTESKASSTSRYVAPNTSSSRKSTSRASKPNTYESTINQRAAQLDSALQNASSQDWDNLYSSTSSSASSGSVGGAGTLTSGKSNSVSTMFMIGVGLLVAAACGVFAFIYLQFFSKKHRRTKPAAPKGRGPKNSGGADNEYGDDFNTAEIDSPVSRASGYTPRRNTAPADTIVVPPSRPRATQDTIHDFTDINSSSDGIQHREEYEEFVERTRPPIVLTPALKKEPEVHDKDTMVLPDLSNTEAKQRARQAQVARVASRKHQPPLTSNAVPRNLRGRPTATGRMPSPSVSSQPKSTYRAPASSSGSSSTGSAAPKKPSTTAAGSQTAASIRQQLPPKKSSNSDFDWDGFLNENRH